MLKFAFGGTVVASRKRKRKSQPKKGLLEQVLKLTGIPTQTIRRELVTIMKKKKINPEEISLDQLRSIATSYLKEIMGGLLESPPIRRQDRVH